jgi:hypothetical protein
MTQFQLEQAIDAAARLHRRLIEAKAATLDDRPIMLDSAQVRFETLALAMGRKIEDRDDA